MSRSLEIANTIQRQIGIQNLMCQGAHGFLALPETKEAEGGLFYRFSNCFKIRSGSVCVALKWDDTYTVTIKDSKGKEHVNMSDVYCEDLKDIGDLVGA